jgi:hypothetical protein
MNRNEANAVRSSMPGASSNSHRAELGAQVHIERVSIIAEGNASSDLQRHGERLACEIGAILSSKVSSGHIRIGELSLRISADQLNDPSARERIASGVARRIFDSLQD